jgi:hypothetical protein
MACLEVFMVIGESAELDLGRFAGRVFLAVRDLSSSADYQSITRVSPKMFLKQQII